MEYNAHSHISIATSANKEQQPWSEADVCGREELSHWDKQQEIIKRIDYHHAKWIEACNDLQVLNSPPEEAERSPSADSGISMSSPPKPSFMRPTQAFKHKTLTDTPLELINCSSGLTAAGDSSPKKSRFQPREKHIRDESIMRDTEASRLKKLSSHGKSPLQRTGGACDDQSWRDLGIEFTETWISSDSKRSSDSDEYGNQKPKKCSDCEARAAAECAECKDRVKAGFRPFCSKCYAQELEYADLLARTRPVKNMPEAPEENRGPIPYDIQLDYQQRCEHLAKEALWLALREHWPEHQQEKFPESPEQIRFGFTELYEDGFGDSNYPNQCLDLCGQTRYTIWSALVRMIDLRNCIAHRQYCSTAKLSGLMERARVLIVAVGNEELAMEVKVMMEEVEELSKASGAEIASNYQMVLRGEDVKWKIYHQNFFFRSWILKDLPGVIGQAANAWRSINRIVGEDEDFAARVKKVKSWTYWKYCDREVAEKSCYADRVDGDSAAGAIVQELPEDTAGEVDGSSRAGEIGVLVKDDCQHSSTPTLSQTKREVKEVPMWPETNRSTYGI